MQLQHQTLLRLLAVKYNNIVNSTTINPNLPNFDNTDDYRRNLRDDTEDMDEIELQLEEIECEMIVLLSCASRKRTRLEDVEKNPKKWGKRGKYNMSKVYFTNPLTGERETFR